MVIGLISVWQPCIAAADRPLRAMRIGAFAGEPTYDFIVDVNVRDTKVRRAWFLA